jgi:predicted metal-dependent HD superfamily phosphohydrolase
MNTAFLFSQTAEHVQRLFESNKREYLLYHNLNHTKLVVSHAVEIANYYKLNESSQFILLTAAWFHDTGQLTGDVNVHEERSVEFMKQFLKGKVEDQTIIDAIARCIMATKMPVSPGNQLEEIICDADTYHLGTDNFLHLDKMVWQEVELRTKKPVDNKIELSLRFLENHQFFTGYCLRLLSAGKRKNIETLRALL